MKKVLAFLVCLIFMLGCVACKPKEPTTESTTVTTIEPMCGNTQTTVFIGEDKYTFMGGNSVKLTTLLNSLRFKPECCFCAPEYYVNTEFGLNYGINLLDGYVRYNGEQVDLTKEQYETVKEILDWVKIQKPDPKVKIASGDSYSDITGVSIKAKKIKFANNDSALTVEWKNKTDYDVIYGESYKIERFENDKWINCQIDELIFNDLATCLSPQSRQKEEYYFFYEFNLTAPGKYRIVTDCFVYKNGRGKKADKCNLGAEFTLS